MIIQTNTFICEICGRMESVTKEVGIYDDPVIIFPENTRPVILCPENDKWGYRYISDGGDDKLRCPECLRELRDNKEE